MADDKLAVINAAMREIGEPEVASAGENDASTSLDNVYDEARRELLRDYHWPFATKRATLSAGTLSTEEALEWDYVFTEPADWLRTIALSHNGDFRAGLIHEWAFESGRFLCNHDAAYLQYVFDETTTTNWDAGFDAALPLMMALKSSRQITNSDSLSRRLEELLVGKRYQSRSNAAGDKGPTRLPTGRWNRARRGTGLTGGWGQFP